MVATETNTAATIARISGTKGIPAGFTPTIAELSSSAGEVAIIPVEGTPMATPELAGLIDSQKDEGKLEAQRNSIAKLG